MLNRTHKHLLEKHAMVLALSTLQRSMQLFQLASKKTLILAKIFLEGDVMDW